MTRVLDIHEVGRYLLPCLAAVVILHATWSHSLLKQARATPGLLAWQSFDLPSDPLDLADDSWDNFQKKLPLLLPWAAVHLAGQALLREKIVKESPSSRKHMPYFAAWSFTCTMAMLVVLYGLKNSMLPLVWAVANVLLAYMPLPPESIAFDAAATDYAAASSAVPETSGQRMSMSRSASSGDRSAPRCLLWLPLAFNIGVFAFFGPFTNMHYGLATFFFMLRCISFSADMLEVRQGGLRAGLGAAELEDLASGRRPQ